MKQREESAREQVDLLPPRRALQGPVADRVLALQRGAGNHAVTALIQRQLVDGKGNEIEPKLWDVDKEVADKVTALQKLKTRIVVTSIAEFFEDVGNGKYDALLAEEEASARDEEAFASEKEEASAGEDPYYSSDEEPDEDEGGSTVFYHATTLYSARQMTQKVPVKIAPLGKGEFGKGFYMFQDLDAAVAIAPEYAKEHGAEEWGIISFSLPRKRWRQFKRYLRSKDKQDRAGSPYQGWGPHPGKGAPPSRHGPNEFWHDFVTQDGYKEQDRGFSLIKGPLKQTLSLEDPHPTQFLVAHDGLDLLNSSDVARQFILKGHVGGEKARRVKSEPVRREDKFTLPTDESSSEESEQDWRAEAQELKMKIKGKAPVRSMRKQIEDRDWPEGVGEALLAYNEERDAGTLAALEKLLRDD